MRSRVWRGGEGDVWLRVVVRAFLRLVSGGVESRVYCARLAVTRRSHGVVSLEEVRGVIDESYRTEDEGRTSRDAAQRFEGKLSIHKDNDHLCMRARMMHACTCMWLTGR